MDNRRPDIIKMAPEDECGTKEEKNTLEAVVVETENSTVSQESNDKKSQQATVEDYRKAAPRNIMIMVKDARILGDYDSKKRNQVKQVRRNTGCMATSLLVMIFMLLTMLLVLTLQSVVIFPYMARMFVDCRIPITDEQVSRVLNFRTLSVNEHAANIMRDNDMNSSSTNGSEFKNEELLRQLRENLTKDMRYLKEALEIGLDVEKVHVSGINGQGKVTIFIHDWSANYTGIVDLERCFLAPLQPEAVLPPAQFAEGIRGGLKFEVWRMRTVLAAVLPALLLPQQPAQLPFVCRLLPLYQLYTQPLVAVVVKRPEDEPAPDFVHFSGKHVNEIRITNMEEIIEHEKKLGEM